MRRVGRARLNAPDSKSDIVARLSGVRIPASRHITQQVIEKIIVIYARNDENRPYLGEEREEIAP